MILPQTCNFQMGGLAYDIKEEKVYILRDNKLRLEIIQLHHDTLIAGHRK